MSDPAILIRLDDDNQTYLPGETLSGDFRIESLDAETLQVVEVSVLWHSEGKGDEDFAVHEFWRNNIESGALREPRRPDRFSTVLPRSPLSYEGQIVKIRWCVRVRAILKRGRDIVAQKPFRLGNVPPVKPPKIEVNEVPSDSPLRSGRFMESQ